MTSYKKIPLKEKKQIKEKPYYFRDSIIEKLEKVGCPVEIIKEVEDRLNDSLTGLPRSGTAKEAINKLIKEGQNVVLEFNDLMYLKVFNKTIGFEETNEMLKKIGKIYREKMEEFSKKGVKIIISRYGGDEFLIIIGEKNEKAKSILDEIKRELRKIQKPNGAPFKPRFYRGFISLEELPPEKRNFRNLIELADKRVNKQKKITAEKWKKRAKRKPAEKYKRTREFLKLIRRYSI